MNTVKELLEDVAPFLSLSELSSFYFGKGRSWLFNKINQNEINGIKYSFTRSEVGVLSSALLNLSKRIASTSERLNQLSGNLKRQSGVYFTSSNPFKHPLFSEWYDLIPNPTTIIEPFAGSCSIPSFLSDLNIIPQWKCYDIEPIHDTPYHTIKRDCIANMPRGKVFITNPPYLAMNSARRRGLQYPNTNFRDIYLYTLELMLNNGKYIAAIIPDSFITTGLFRERLFGVISLNGEFFVDTDCPVSLALFVPGVVKENRIYRGDEYIGDIEGLRNSIRFRHPSEVVDWKFNEPQGSIAVKCFDGINDGIRFMDGNAIPSGNIYESNRHYTRINGLPDGTDKDAFIIKCNDILTEYRNKTHDIFLTSFRGRRSDGAYRRRVDFGTLREIMDTALCELSQP